MNTTEETTTVGAQHFLTWGTSETYLCGANAVGRRNTRVDTDRTKTTCRQCREVLAAMDEDEAQNNR